jgi:hypothetical protein
MQKHEQRQDKEEIEGERDGKISVKELETQIYTQV